MITVVVITHERAQFFGTRGQTRCHACVSFYSLVGNGIIVVNTIQEQQ